MNPALDASHIAGISSNKRSLDSEVLIRLTSAGFAAPAIDREELMRRLDAFVDTLPPVDHSLVDQFKREH